MLSGEKCEGAGASGGPATTTATREDLARSREGQSRVEKRELRDERSQLDLD